MTMATSRRRIKGFTFDPDAITALAWRPPIDAWFAHCSRG
jgi:hypothetical protein